MSSFDLFFEVSTTDSREAIAAVISERMRRELEIYTTAKWAVTTEDFYFGDLGPKARFVRMVVSALSLEDACHDVTETLRDLLDFRYDEVRLVVAMALRDANEVRP